MRRPILLLLLLHACGWGQPAEPVAKKSEAGGGRGRRGAPDVVNTGSPRKVPDAIADGPTVDQLPKDQPGLVVFVVLDTVRSASLHACGNERPTSKVLETLVEKGAALTCNAYSPATWTLPSHATFFTGVPATEHLMHRKGLRLPEEAETMAEVWQSRGYQTVMLSANPVLKAQTGLQQGFQSTYAPKGLSSDARQEGLVSMLRQQLSRIDPTRPLFLFLNVFEAHDPYPAIPQGIPGVTPQSSFAYKVQDATDKNPWYRFVQGTMPADEQEKWLASAKDGYEYGVGSSDRVLGKLLKLLEQHKLEQHGVRLVVTSDHGENLGEHHMMRHDGPPWETVTRVPFLYYDSTRAEQIKLPEPFPTEVVFHLLNEGSLPEAMPPVRSLSMGYDNQDPRYRDGAALWVSATEKLAWLDGKVVRYDLAADPAEDKPLSAEGHPRAADMATFIAAQQAAKAKADAATPDEEVVKMLEEVGYVD